VGAADGPEFAPVPKGAVSVIDADPCGCRECVAGDGIPFAQIHADQFAKIFGELSTITNKKFCAFCNKTVIVTAILERVPVEHWINVCENEHVWQTYG